LRISSLAPRCANGAALEVGAGGGKKGHSMAALPRPLCRLVSQCSWGFMRNQRCWDCTDLGAVNLEFWNIGIFPA
jgi:hypothetical protein